MNIHNWTPAPELIPNYIDMWYDSKTRFWVVQVMTEEGFQIGNAEYVSGKVRALNTKKELEEKHLNK